MAFIPGVSEWVESHYRQVPQETMQICGSLAGLRILDVGCGEMLSDFGLLAVGAAHVTGLDVHAHAWDVVEAAAGKLVQCGIAPENQYGSRLLYRAYDGERFPFPDACFDFVFSWSAFEHIATPLAVLGEMRRVVRPGGRVFIQVFPWFPCFHGSHLTDYISEPFFHLRRSRDWVRARLEEYASAHPESAAFVLGTMWNEFCVLNRYSAAMFFADVARSPFSTLKTRLITYDQDLSEAPEDIPVLDLMISGSMVLLAPSRSPVVTTTEIVSREAAVSSGGAAQHHSSMFRSARNRLTPPRNVGRGGGLRTFDLRDIADWAWSHRHRDAAKASAEALTRS